MNGKTTSRLLIWGGVLFLLFGVFMDTSGDTSFGDVVNVSLVARQQMFLILGGIGLIGGIVLHGFGRLKQTPHDEAHEAEAQQHAKETIEKELSAARERGGAIGLKIGTSIKQKLDDHGSMRLVSGTVTGLWLGVVSGLNFSGWFGVVVFAACMAYAVWAADAQRGRVRLFMVALIVACMLGAFFAAATIPVLGLVTGFSDVRALAMLWFLKSWIGVGLISPVAWFLAFRWARRESRYVSAKAPAT
jgi:hypothetical protein